MQVAKLPKNSKAKEIRYQTDTNNKGRTPKERKAKS